MEHLKIIQQFLSEKRSFEDLPEYGFPFVTISRQSGAGGQGSMRAGGVSNFRMTSLQGPLFTSFGLA